MCDWEAEEFAEYLLWVEAERARTRVRLQPRTETALPKEHPSAELSHEVAEA